MATTNFTNGVTLTDAGWFNDVDFIAYDGTTAQILVGGGAGTLAVWTTATGTGSPVRAGSPTFTGVVKFAAGAVGAPSIYLSTDTTTGWYNIGANNPGFAISGVKLLDMSAAVFNVTGQIQTTTSFLSGAPAGGAAVAWRFGSAAVVSPSVPNRTLQVEVAGVLYYIHAKTTND